MKLHVGLKGKLQLAIFESEKVPSKETHPQHNFIFNPFKNREEAEKYVNAMDRGVAYGEG